MSEKAADPGYRKDLGDPSSSKNRQAWMKNHFASCSDFNEAIFREITLTCEHEAGLAVLESGKSPTEDFFTTSMDKRIWEKYHVEVLGQKVVPEWPWGDREPDQDIHANGVSTTFTIWGSFRLARLQNEIDLIKWIIGVKK